MEIQLRLATTDELPHALHQVVGGEALDFALTNAPRQPVERNLLDVVGNEASDIDAPDTFEHEEKAFGVTLAGPPLVVAGVLALGVAALVPAARAVALVVGVVALGLGAPLTLVLLKWRRQARRQIHWYVGSATRLLHQADGHIRALPWAEVKSVTWHADAQGRGQVSLLREGAPPILLTRLPQAARIGKACEARIQQAGEARAGT